MTWAKRVDGTQREVVDALRQCGCKVCDLSRVGGGIPDLIVRRPDGVQRWVEVKAKRGKLRASQLAFQAEWPDPILVLRSAEDAVTWATGR